MTPSLSKAMPFSGEISSNGFPSITFATGCSRWLTVLLAVWSEELMLYRATGCKHCNHTGYDGRIALHELLEITPALRRTLLDGADAAPFAPALPPADPRTRQIRLDHGIVPYRLRRAGRPAPGVPSETQH